MSALAMLVVAVLQSQTGAAGVATQQPQQTVEPPVQVSVQGVSAERTVAEFMDVCFRPNWNPDALRQAAKSSDFAYEDESANHPTSFGWKSKRAILRANLAPDFSQCALSIASIQPRTGEQILAVLKPAVEAEVGHPVQENDEASYLQWVDALSGEIDRITLAGSGSSPKQALWYIFERTTPMVREQLDNGSYLKARSQ